MPYQIKRVAVIGAGTMGAAIAGLVAGAGLPVLLLDMPPSKLTPEEEAKGLSLAHPAVRNRFVQAGFDRMRKARPSNLYNQNSAKLISLGNTEDDFEKLADVDWIVEVIIEQLAPKQALMERIEAVRKPGAIVTSNTSGIPIGLIAEGRSDEFKRHFFGAHFFNPPRYLKLLELIPGEASDPAAVAAFRSFAENTLGKGVVICKDRPNFIGNRIFSYAGQVVLNEALARGYTVEELDALTGSLIGRPNTASCRLLDQVGVDVMHYVASNLYKAIPEDESREVYTNNDLLERMVAAGRLGKKVGQGFYKEVREGKKREFWSLDLQSFEYVAPQGTASVDAFINEAKKQKALPERLRFMLRRAAEQPDDRGAAIVTLAILPMIAYAARRLPEIADSVADVDSAIRWGFAHQLGPFQIWDALGVAEGADLMKSQGLDVPAWVDQLIAKGDAQFYGDGTAYNVATGRHEPLVRDPRAIDLAALKAAGHEVLGNAAASLIDLGDGVLCFEIHSKANAIGGPVVEILLGAIEELKNDKWVGMVIGNQGARFSAGFDLNELGAAVQMGAWDDLGELIELVQQTFYNLRYAAKPVVTAPFAHTLGGGAEFAMHGAVTVAAAETYMGLPEFAVGLVPGWGGCTQLNRRIIAETARNGGDTLKAFQQVFETLAFAKIATSALEARDLGYLRSTDRIVFNQDYLIGEAKREVLQLVGEGYTPPTPGNHCYALGRDGLAAARIAIYQLRQGNFATEYDAIIAEKIAHILCGGELSNPQFVDEQYLLSLEREALLFLGQDERTLARAKHMMETGKPLRN
ncbi:3-hydroxyacyl-CoA dehydrogenase/enoyl-CoA hydratase family protein [Candidatus Chloroploca sp. M-50]|uniref:3-hydroxyacyl-CoA dehydrogenase/enoyl-CoA hydratase family protein n=1 Tax=Candidatus Chloroploca mongolica TaxID=2528176 RepID=A0ABS4D6T0_9CHLR|nr:3-hydroxyacyl-CoA dehydrogenase/enoyl-CoA hydratase family protein [Candidatus Chloroploca mongolica]MBP1465143.1 3-hydroxyacyl-CoA dehydrogenase/enoyl-CoA hydratase family protein [Candidatus Chloroploca mongolica]